ncbi:hypothetical protein ACOALZ_15420 [Nocardiopsis algeriensis]|uniref:hypothetical protein n=1 Tax=Nocardiopsis algeriensis TaxID=1478215 RepID=UPI003B437955
MPPIDVIRPVDDPRSQQALPMDFMVLIVPDCIPIPGTSVEILQGAAADMRTAGEEICEGGEGIEATWQGLQPHYTAPESEDLFAAMGPVATKGGTIQDDFTAVADALDTFADEADTAKTKLRSLKEDARAFVEEVGDDEKWNADLENFHRNRQLILEVNRVWGAFQEAERACANAIAAVTGSGNTYVAAGEGPPDTGEIAYGIDPADIPDSVYDLTTFEGWKQGLGDSWEHLTHADFPWPVDWARDAYMVQWDYFGPGMLWDTGVGAVAGIGLWREGSGWASSVGEAADNFVAHKTETLQGYGALAGFYGEEGWMNPFDADERSWDTWKANAGPVWTEVAHDLVPWREWDERPAYTVTATAGNVALAVVGLPVRGGMLAAKIGNLASGGVDTGGADLGAFETRGLDGGGQRPATFWGNGTAADPGFDLSGYISRAQSGFGETMSEINGRLGEIDTGALANISEWSANRGLTGAGTDSRGPAPEPAGESSVFNPTPGRQDASAGSGGREDEPAWREASSVTGERSEQNAEPQDSGNDMDRGLAELLDSENGSSAPLDALPPRDVAASEVNAPGRPIELSDEAMERTTQELLEEVEAFKADAPELWEQLHRRQEALVGSDGMEINASDGNRVDARSDLDITNSAGDDNTKPRIQQDHADESRRDGTRRPASGSSESGGDRPRLRGSQMTSAQRLQAAQPYLEGLDTSSGRAFVEDFMNRANKHPELYDIFYRKDGQRWDINDVIVENKYGLPQAQKVNGILQPKSELPDPIPPKYLTEGDREFIPRREHHPDNAKLDLMSGVRRDEAISYIERRDELEIKDNDPSTDKNGDEYKGLVEEKSKNHGRMTRSGEFYGEESADSYLPEIFDGERQHSVRWVDENGETRTKKITLPEIAGDNLLNKVETAPKSGNFQFDLVHLTSDGGFVITEAKADLKTKLGDRKVGSGFDTRRVSQGTIDYLKATCKDMITRGQDDLRSSDEPFGSGYINEKDLARRILKALDSNKVYYAEIKGASTPTGEHSGVSFGLFDISSQPEPEKEGEV